MIPQGTGWQYLRSLSLDAIPPGTKVYHKGAFPLHEWKTHGAYTVPVCTNNFIKIEASGAELGSALLSDVEHLMDHAAEHQASVHDFLAGSTWYSPTWALVTTYYWCFFSALALTRLTGRSVWFLDRASISQMKTIAGSSAQPSAGAMKLTLDPFISGTTREMTLKPSKLQLHDAVWTAAQKLFNEMLEFSDENGNPLEYRLWWSIKQAADRWGSDWPSKLRNIVNYRPGFGYREIIKRDRIDTLRGFRKGLPFTFDDILTAMENAVMSIRSGTKAGEDPQLGSALLCLYAVMLSGIIRSLHSEILTRQSGDLRWRDQRRSFLVSRCATSPGSIWPF